MRWRPGNPGVLTSWPWNHDSGVGQYSEIVKPVTQWPLPGEPGGDWSWPFCSVEEGKPPPPDGVFAEVASEAAGAASTATAAAHAIAARPQRDEMNLTDGNIQTGSRP